MCTQKFLIAVLMKTDSNSIKGTSESLQENSKLSSCGGEDTQCNNMESQHDDHHEKQ